MRGEYSGAIGIVGRGGLRRSPNVSRSTCHAPYQPQDLRGLLEFCRLYPRFQPLLLCNEGDEALGRDGGVRTQSWANFLMHGPDALVVRKNTSRPQRSPSKTESTEQMLVKPPRRQVRQG